VTTKGTTRSSLWTIKKDYKALGPEVMDSGVQGDFSSVLLVKRRFEWSNGLKGPVEFGKSSKWLQD